MSDETKKDAAPAVPAAPVVLKTAQKRIFIAVNASVDSIRRVADVQMSMRPTAKSRGLKVTWVPAASMHLTVRYLGWVAHESPDALRDMLRQKLATVRPFSFTLAGVGAFPSADKPRVLWVGVKDSSGELTRLATSLEGWVQELGFPAEAREWQGHLTLGRVKEGGSAVDVLAPHRDKQFGVSTVNEVVIYESKTLSTGAEYTPLARVGLGLEPDIVWPESEPWQPGRGPRAASPESDVE